MYANLIHLGSTPSLSMLTGRLGSKGLLDRINSTCNANGGMIIGTEADPLAARYNSLKSTIKSVLEGQLEQIKRRTINLIAGTKFQLIDNEDDLEMVPISMRPWIVSHDGIRDHVSQGHCYGWDIPDAEMFASDVINRVLYTGTCDINKDDLCDEYTIAWEWDSDDPELTFKERDILIDSCNWIDKFIKREIADGTLRDFSSLSDRMDI